jgi:hypothetical protein
MAIETVISAYNAARGIGSSRSDASASAEPDDLMKGRTFIPRMSEASRQALIEAMQKAKKNRQERLAKKKETGEIGSGFPKTDLTSGQGSKADDKLNAVLIRDGIEPIPSDQAETKPKVAPINQTSTNNQNIEEEDPEEEVSDNLVSEQVVGEGPEQAASSGPTSEDLGAAIRRRRSLNENRRRFGPVFERIKNRRERQGTTVGETDNLETPEIVESTQSEVTTGTDIPSNTEVIQDQTSTEKKEKTRGFLKNIFKNKSQQGGVDEVSTDNNTAITNQEPNSPATITNETTEYESVLSSDEEGQAFIDNLNRGVNPAHQQNNYIQPENRQFSKQEGDRDFVGELTKLSPDKDPERGQFAETVLAAIKGSISGNLPEKNIQDFVREITQPNIQYQDAGMSYENLNNNHRYENIMRSLGIEDYPKYEDLYIKINGVPPSFNIAGEKQEGQVVRREAYNVYNLEGRKIWSSTSSGIMSPKIFSYNLGSALNNALYMETDPTEQELISLIKNDTDESKKKAEWDSFSSLQQRMYDNDFNKYKEKTKQAPRTTGEIKRLQKYAAYMLSRYNNLPADDKRALERVFRASSKIIDEVESKANGGKIPYYNKKRTIKYRK